MKGEVIVVNKVGFPRRTLRLFMAVGAILILVVQGLSASPVKDAPATSSSEVLDATDVAVIHAAVPAVFEVWSEGRTRTDRSMVVVMMTEGPAALNKEHSFGSGAPLRETDSTAPLMRSLLARNAVPFFLGEPVSSGTVTIAGDRLVLSLMKEGKLESRFGAGTDYLEARLPGYNQSRTEAVVYVSASSDPSYLFINAGHLVFLRRDGASWKSVRIQELWWTHFS